MLHVFYVNVGCMLKFELDAVKNNVTKLQDLIARQLQVPIDKQILLVSGGENVCQSRKIASYSSGSDTTPFFLYHKNCTEVYIPPLEVTIPPAEKNLQAQLRESLSKPISLELTALRANIAKSISLLGRQKVDSCQELVHSQHLQHQGWAVVIANLLDVASEYLRKADSYMENLNSFHSFNQDYLNLLQSIPQAIHTLGQIILPPSLPIDSFHHSSFILSSSTSSSSSSNLVPRQPFKMCTLLDWINTHDSRNSLHRLVEEGRKSLQEFNQDSKLAQLKEMEGFKELVVVDRKEMKIIRGLDDRLSGLDRLMANNKKLLKEQEDMAEMFFSVHQRLQGVQDTAMLAGLCSVHKEYLERLLYNHQTLLENLSKCHKTKHELCDNLNNRLKWVMLSEQSLWQADNRLLMRHKKLNKLRHNLHILHQINSSSQIYCRALAEVVRRRSFRQVFLKRASVTSSYYSDVHKREVEKRRHFEEAVHIQEHFLKALFPGLREEHPPFALKCPEEFDKDLPEITFETIQSILASVPELAVFLEDVDFSSIDPLLTAPENHSQHSSSTLKNPPNTRQQHSSKQPTATNKQTQTDKMFAARLLNESNEKSNEKSNSSSLSKSFEFVQDKFEQVKLVQSADTKSLLAVASSASATPLCTPPLQTCSNPLQTVFEPSQDQPSNLASHSQSFSTTSPSLIPPPPSSPPSLSSPLPLPLFNVSDHSPLDSFIANDSYFDECTTPPFDQSSSKKMVELQGLLQERVVQLEKKEKEVKELTQGRAEDSEEICLLLERYKKLADFCFEGLDETKKFLYDVKSDHVCFIGNIKQELLANKRNFERLAEDVVALLSSKDTHVTSLKGKCTEMMDCLEEKNKQLNEMKEKFERMNESLEKETQALKEVVGAKDEELLGLKTRYNKLVLESELELERNKCEVAEEVSEKEKRISELEREAQKAHLQVGLAREEASVQLRETKEGWQKKKKKEIEAMEKDFVERSTRREGELREELGKEYEEKNVNERAVAEAKHSLKVAEWLRQVRQVRLEVACLKNDLQHNHHYHDCIISDSTEFINIKSDVAENRAEGSSVVIRNDVLSLEVAEVHSGLKGARALLTGLLEEVAGLKEQMAQKEKLLHSHTTEVLVPYSHEPSQSSYKTPPQAPFSQIKDVSTSTNDTQGLIGCTCNNTGVLTKQRHEQLLAQAVAAKNQEKDLVIEQWKRENLMFCEDLIANMKAEQDADVADMRQRLKRELEEQRQITFNKALKQALKGRDETIAQLEALLEHSKKPARTKQRDFRGKKIGVLEGRQIPTSSICPSFLSPSLEPLPISSQPLPSSSQPLPSSSQPLPSSSQQLPSSPQPLLSSSSPSSQLSPSHPRPFQNPFLSSSSSSSSLSPSKPSPSHTLASSPPKSSSSSSSSSCSLMSPSSSSHHFPSSSSHPLPSSSSHHFTMMQSCPDYVEKVHQLEVTLKSKEEENKRLKSKLNSSSKKENSHDHVNLKSCTEGSIVLFVQDTVTNHYVAYLPSNPVKCFLHSDSIPLFQNAFSPMPSWIVAEVTGKDLCQAKKASNRFRVAVGSKFYRVKAKPLQELGNP